MTEEERAIIYAALAFAAADRADDEAQAAADAHPNNPRLAWDADGAWNARCERLDDLLAAVARYQEARRG